MRKKSLHKHYGKRILAIFVTAAMILPSNFGIPLFGNSSDVKSKVKAAEVTTLTDTQVDNIYASTFDSNSEHINERVSVHDPSIVVGYEGSDGKVYPEDAAGRKKVYYIFGSHIAWAYSYDLINWTTFKNNLSDHSESEKQFQVGYNWSKQGDSGYSLFASATDDTGNLWAPDVFWNETMGKWCMYMSVNGNNWNSTIALLTSDSLNGNWTYVDTVVYSGFTATGNNKFTETDYTKVTGETTLPERFKLNNTSDTTWNYRYGAHAIDPCVFYDEDGNLWMTYGSWSGGIWMFKLDKTTGLRDTSTKYEYVDGVTDPYMGYKLAGGSSRSGEASYIEYIDGKYYLFVTYGGLVSTGGYNMRVFSSDEVTGPYLDLSGEDARYPQSAYAGESTRTVGTRPMSYYQWDHIELGFTAQGHNSAFVDTDGKAYLIYHTRFNNGTEWHQVRVHQLFTSENGGLLAAPFEYAGESLSETGYEKSSVTGSYRILYHTSSINFASLECVKEQEITLNADGTISGDYTGTWTMKDNTPYVSLTTGNVTYSGVFLEQEIEETDLETMCFTLAGTNDVAIWGYKIPEDDVVVAVNAKNLSSIPSLAYGDVELPSADDLLWGAEVSWSSSNPEILSEEGVVTTPSVDTEVILTATISKGNYKYEKLYTITVRGDTQDQYDSSVDAYLVASYFENSPQTLANHKNGDFFIDNPFNENTTSGVNTRDGVIIQFDISNVGAMNALGAIFSFMGNNGDNGRLYFTPGSYLGYNATGGYFDANLKNYALVKDYIGTGGTVQIKFTTTGFTISVNGTVAYTESILSTENGASTLTDYTQVLSWLNQTADKVYFGYGVWPGWDPTANCSISNLKFYVCKQENNGTGINPNDPGEGTEPAQSAGVLYAQNYENVSSVSNLWTSTNASGYLRLLSDTEQFGNYLDFSLDANAGSGSRGAYSNFGINASDVAEDYIVETDVYLDGKSAGTSPIAQFAITTEGYTYTSNNINYGLASGYILNLSTANTTTWTINGDNTNTVEIPVEWVHIKAEVDVSEKKAHITITGENVSYNGDVAINGSTNVQGLYILAGRQYGSNHVDNTYVYRTEITKSEDNLSFAVNRASYTASNDIVYYDNPLYGQTISELSIQYTINWMANAVKNGWDSVFSFYNSTTGGRVSVQTAPYICFNNLSGTWLDINGPANADLGATDIAPSLAKGKDHTIKWKITATTITADVNGTKIGISEVTDNACTNTDLLNYIATCDKFTLGTGSAATSYWDTELCSISDLVISAQPTNNSVYIANDGQNAYGSVLRARVNTSSESVPSYQWYTAATETGTYTAISGETSSTYSPKASDIGKYIKVKVVIDGDEVESEAVQIIKRELIVNITIKDKTYDETVDAETASEELIGVVNNDNVTYTISAKFADANVGSSKNVDITITLDDIWKSCYELKESSFGRVAEIFKAVPTYEISTLYAEIGDTLADVELPDGFSFEDSLDTALSEEKEYTVKLTYTPKDTINYTVVENIEAVVIVSSHVHTWIESTVKEPTCTEKGTTEYICTTCNETKIEQVDALGHDYEEDFTIDQEPTCTEAGSKSRHCSRCDEKIDITEIEMLGHISDEGTVTLEPGCQTEGTKVYKCSRCDEVLETEVLPALGHDWSEWITDKEATVEEDGQEHRICERCSEIETRVIPKIETWSGTTEVSGDFTYGSIVSASAIVENLRDGIRLDYKWYHSDSVSEKGTEIVGASDGTYTLTKEDIGKYLSVEISSKSYIGSLTGEGNGPVQKRVITIDAVTVEDKPYDTTTKAAIEKITFQNTVENEEVSYMAEAFFTSANASEQAQAIVTVILTGDSEECYILQNNTIETTASITKIDPEYTLPTGLTTVYGTTLGAITLPEGFAFEDSLDTIVGDVGINTKSVVYTPVDSINYNELSGLEVEIEVTQAIPEYQVPKKLIASYGQTLKELQDSLLKDTGFTFEEPLTTEVGEVGIHTFTLTYTPEDTKNYKTVTGIKVQVEVQASTDYEVPTGLMAVYGDTLADVELPEGFTFEDELTTSVGNAGVNVFTVTYTPVGGGSEVNGIEVNITVSKADPEYTILSDLKAKEGQTLKDIELPAGFAFKDELTTSVGVAGSHEFEVVYTPEDTQNYNVVTDIKVTIIVTGDNNDNPSEGDNNNNNNSNNNSGSSNNGSSSINNSNSSGNNGTNQPSDNTSTQEPEDDKPLEQNPSQSIVETKPDGTKVETVTETQEDGTVKETVTETKPDGSITETVTETKPDGSVTQTKEVTTADNSAVLNATIETDTSGNSSANAVIRTGVSNTSNTVNISEELLKDVAANKIDKVIVEVTDTTIQSATSNTKNTVVTVNIPSVEGVEVEKVVITKESIEVAKEKGKGLKVNVTTNDASNNYTVTIPVKQLAKVNSSVEEINITVNAEQVGNVADSSKKTAITKIVTNNNGKKKKTCVVSLASNENINAGIKVTVPVTEKTTITKGSTVYVYKYDAKTGKLIEAANCKREVSADGSVVISVADGTDYVISAKKLSGNKVETIKDNISISVSKKTAKIGKKLNVTVSLPDTVSTKTAFGTEKATITYKSSNSKVASVSKDGAISTKKTGTVTITTTVKLASGQKVVKAQKITVK